MIFRERLLAMIRLGQATLRVAERSVVARIADEEAERMVRLGDLEGQTTRARAFAERLEGSVLVKYDDAVIVKPHGWFS